MESHTLWLVAAGIGLMAALDASVGHASASGHLAVMALAGVAPEQLRPIALVLTA